LWISSRPRLPSRPPNFSRVPKINTAVPKDNSIWAEMYHYFMYNREEFLAHYHKRSNVETAFSMIKGKFGDAVRSKSDIGQLNEVLCKVLCHNLCVLIQAIHELGIEPMFEKTLGGCPKKSQFISR
jgi:hypothetical protein